MIYRDRGLFATGKNDIKNKEKILALPGALASSMKHYTSKPRSNRATGLVA